VIGVVFVSLHLNSSNSGKPRSSTDYRWHAVMCVLSERIWWEFPAVWSCYSDGTGLSYTVLVSWRCFTYVNFPQRVCIFGSELCTTQILHEYSSVT
jgi:hypothetical protein